MTQSLTQINNIWLETLHKIKVALNEDPIYICFFEGTYVHSIVKNHIIVATNTKLAATCLKTTYYSLISDKLKEVSETDFEIEFVSKDDLPSSKINIEKLEKARSNTYFENAKINPQYTFDNFVVGPFNREASQAALLVASKPGKMFNPLFIYSYSGLGKTHLMHAIGNSILKNSNPNSNILYITANDFVEEYIKYVRADKDSESLKDYFKTVDVLLLDDVQFLADKVKTSEMFFYIYQHFIQEGKQIVITSDRQPNEIKNLEDRLVSRFNQGLVVSINEPDQPTCVEILKKKIIANGQNLSIFDDDVISYLALKFSKNVRELEGALNRLIFYVINLKQANVITMDLALEALQPLTGAKVLASELNESKIINVVSDYYNLTPSQLKGKSRNGQIAMARHIAMYLIRITIPNASLKKIGELFGGKDHTTVINAISKVEKELKTDQTVKTAIDELQKRIKE